MFIRDRRSFFASGDYNEGRFKGLARTFGQVSQGDVSRDFPRFKSELHLSFHFRLLRGRLCFRHPWNVCLTVISSWYCFRLFLLFVLMGKGTTLWLCGSAADASSGRVSMSLFTTSCNFVLRGWCLLGLRVGPKWYVFTNDGASTHVHIPCDPYVQTIRFAFTNYATRGYIPRGDDYSGLVVRTTRMNCLATGRTLRHL